MHAPTSPRKNWALPMTFSKGVAFSYRSLSPPHRKMSCPFSAGCLEPDTGASRYVAPVALIACSSRKSSAHCKSLTVFMACLSDVDKVAERQAHNVDSTAIYIEQAAKTASDGTFATF